MTAYWEPGTSYGPGDIVEYEGMRSQLLYDHESD